MAANSDQSERAFDPVVLRKTILEMAYAGSTVHIGCAFSIVEILAVLYRSHLRYPDNNPSATLRDFLVLSKGHGVMAQYACMRELGWLSDKDIQSYFANGTKLKGLSDSRVRGLEVTSGSLGHGFSVGVGIAMGLKRHGTDQRVYSLVGDGEINEGPVWEGALVAAHHGLDNLMLIVDQNGFQAMGATDEIIRLGDLRAKLQSFGFDSVDVDGHNQEQIDSAIRTLWNNGTGQPKAIIAKTVKGKGVSFMENANQWHYTRLDQNTYRQALASLDGDVR
jgi:transketolase